MSSDTTSLSERIVYWNDRWVAGQTGYHYKDLHPFMSKHIDKLIPDGKANKVFFPLCGRAVDMKWLADMGFIVVGVEGVPSVIEAFMKEHGLGFTVEDVPQVGKNAQVFKSTDGQIRIYCCDILDFTSELEGSIDAVWDRGSLVALYRKDVAGYVQVMKNILSSRGRILLEVFEYDVSIFADVTGPVKYPPPYPMYEEEIKQLFEPECTVEFVEKNPQKFGGRDVHVVMYLIVKKS